MSLVPRFYELVSEVFSQIAKEHNLSIVAVRDFEVAIYSDSFLLLACVDPDGFSIDYVDYCVKGRLAIIDIASFFLLKRKFAIDTSGPEGEDLTSIVHRELLKYAKTLQLEGQDILKGDKEWLAGTTGKPFVLSELHDKIIRSTIQSDRHCGEGQNGQE